MSDLNELRKIAEAATPGPWTVMDVNDTGEGVNFIDVHQDGKSWEVVSRRLPDRHDDRDQMSADATHIATFDPPTVLALITRLEQAERDRVKLRNRLDAMRRQRDGYRNQLRRAEQQVARVRDLSAYLKKLAPGDKHYAELIDRALDGDGRG